MEPVIQTFECVSGLLNFQTSPWCLGEAMKFTESLLLLLKTLESYGLAIRSFLFHGKQYLMIDYVPRAKSIIDGKIGWVFSYF